MVGLDSVVADDLRIGGRDRKTQEPTALPLNPRAFGEGVIAVALISPTTTAAAASAAAFILGSGFVDDEGAAIELLTIQSLDGSGCVLALRHRHETKTARAAGIAIGDDSDFFHFAVLGEEVSERSLRGGKVQITHVDLQRYFLQSSEAHDVWRHAWCPGKG